MDRGNIKDILYGKAVPLPTESSNTVRLFISSTFSDMVEERNALMEMAYPEIQTFCQKHGLTFEVVDMRWGVRDYVSVDHMTTDLCLKEIKACKKTSLGPYFIGLVGNRYGYRPMPEIISEQEFNILYKKICKDEAQAQLLTHWFWKDINAVPPIYVFQPITVHFPHFSDTNPSHVELQVKERKEWKETEKRLSQILRSATENAWKEGMITLEQKHKYFKSVTEWEIDCGFLASDTDEAGTTIFFREVTDIDLCKENALQIIDVKEDGSPDSEARDLLEDLKSRIVQKHPNNVKTLKVELSKQTLKTIYLQKLCDQVIALVNHQILRCLSTRENCTSESEKQYAWLGGLLQEVTHHLHLSYTKSEVFCGRQEILQTIVDRVRNSEACVQSPLVIYGASGSGKTALMCKSFELLRQAATTDGHHVLVLRLLGTSPQSTEIHDVLKSICYQVCLALDLPLPSAQVTNIYNETVRFFHQILTTVSSQRSETLVLFLDSLDQLSSSEGAHHLHWLPKECPANVHIVLSTLPNEGGILNTLREKITDATSYFEVQPLSAEHGGQVIEMLMSSIGRKLTSAQLDIVLESFQKCGQPLLLKLAFDEAKRWLSYTPPSELHIATSTKEAVYQLYQRMENVHGQSLVSHALGYIAACRTGLSEAELKDILSIDDEVLADIYQYWAPPRSDVIRIPVLSWTHLRYDLDKYLVERQADGSTVLGLYHRQFIEVAQEKYLSDSEKKKRHHTLAEYFLGTWSMGTLRWINLPLINKSLNADRKPSECQPSRQNDWKFTDVLRSKSVLQKVLGIKRIDKAPDESTPHRWQDMLVAPQPLWFSKDMPNLRKMNELPYHLLYSGNIDELQREILGNMDWISSKIVACGINSLIKDFDICLKRANNDEVKLVYDTLRLFQPTINFIENQIDPCIIYVEMLARLHFFKQSYPSLIGDLCQQCFTWFEQYPKPTFIPISGFFQPPGGPLQTTLTGFKKGITVMEVCAYKDLVVVGSDDGTIIVWDIRDIEVIHTLNGHSARILCVKVFGQGTRAVSSSLDNTLLLWNLVTGKHYLTIQEDHTIYENAYLHVDEKNGIIYSAAGSQVCGWNIESGALVLCFSPGVPGFPLQAAVYSPQQTLMTVTEGGTVHIWESITGQLRGSRQIPGVDAEAAHPVCSCVIPKYGKMAVGLKNGLLALISTGGGVSAEKMPSALIFVVVSDDESLFAAGFGKQVQVFRADSNTLRTFLESCLEHDDMVKTAVIHSHKKIIVTGSQDETIRIWSLSRRGVLLDTFFGMGVSVTGLALNGSTLISSSDTAYYLKLWNLDYNQKHKTSPPFQDHSGCVALSSGGDRVYFPKTGDKHKIVVWDTVQGLMTDILEASSEVTCLEVANTKRILFCGLTSGTVLAFPLDQRQNVACIPPPDHNLAVICLSLSKQESCLVVAHHNMILLYEVTKGDPLPMLDGPIHSIHPQVPSAVSKVAIFEDHRVIYGTERGDMCLFSPGKEEQCLESHVHKVTCLETSAKEIYALSGCEDSVQRLWSMETGCWEHEMCYKGFFFQGVDCACFSPDDYYIYTGSKDRAIKVWAVSTGSLLAVQYVYATVTRIVSTPDGFIGTTRLGYVIRERFQCPETISPQYNPLQNIKATVSVKSVKSKGANNKAIESEAKSEKKWWRCKEQANKKSQICHIV